MIASDDGLPRAGSSGQVVPKSLACANLVNRWPRVAKEILDVYDVEFGGRGRWLHGNTIAHVIRQYVSHGVTMILHLN